jgi:hypothetical protein
VLDHVVSGMQALAFDAHADAYDGPSSTHRQTGFVRP